jgi:2-dehydropantoate 2-reductase
MPIVCATNGVEGERIALRRAHRVYGAMIGMPAQHLEPGVVQVYALPPGVVDVGRWPGGADPFADHLASALTAAGFVSAARPDIAAWKYAELLTNLGNAFQAAYGLDADDPALLRAARAEGTAVYAAAGIRAVPWEELRARMEQIAFLPIDGVERKGGSTWQSLARGTGASEVDWLNGEIGLLGRLHGVPTPVNDRLQRVVREMARAHQAPGSVGSHMQLNLSG